MIEKDYSFLLNRPEHTFAEKRIDEELLGKRVLITGAGGSIGSALALRISRSGAGALRVVGRSELPIFNLLAELNGPRDLSTLAVSSYIGDAGSASFHRNLKLWQPDIVIHAGAHKHVGLMEEQPGEAFRNNTESTVRFANACEEAGVERFIFISTDKAVNPSSAMGASKRLAEAWLLSHPLDMGVTICRFGNVLGSSGSLVEILEKRAAKGLPFEMRDVAMTRYFITAKEAVGLVLSSGLLYGSGIFTLDMGRPVPIYDIATKLATAPGQKIVWSQGFAGEKMEEEIVGQNERLIATQHSKIFQIVSSIRGNVDAALLQSAREPDDMVSIAKSL